MTLVIARQIDGELFLIADTILSLPNAAKQNPLVISPKIICLERCVVAISGVIEPIYNEWAALSPNIAFTTLLDECTKMIKRYGEHIAFILADVTTKKLMKVSSDGNEIGENFWIGSHEAFNRFQAIALSPDGQNTKLRIMALHCC